MITQIVFLGMLVATASAGLAVSYAARSQEGGSGLGLVGLGRLEGGLEEERGIGLEGLGGERIGLRGVGSDGIGLGLRGIGGEGIGLRGAVIGKERVVDYYTPPKYEFNYGVKDPRTGDRKEQVEERVGDRVRGEYSLAEPDGTVRIVKYEADDKNGFNAVVRRVGKALHPQILVTKKIGVLGGGIGL